MINISKEMKVFFLSILLIGAGCNSDKIKPDEIRIASIDWSVITRTPIDEAAIWKPMNYKKEYNIKDESVIDSLKIRLSKLERINTNIVIDVRISTLIPMSSQDYDTLSFGRNNVIMFKNELYKWDDLLFKKITPHLSGEQQSLILNYFISPPDLVPEPRRRGL